MANARMSAVGTSQCLLKNRNINHRSGRRQNMHDIAVLDHIGLSLEPVDAMSLRLLHGADPFEVVKADHLGADEAPGQVGVDLAGACHGVLALVEAPGPALVLSHGEENDPAHGCK